MLACEQTPELAKIRLQTKDSKSEAIDLPSSGFSEPIAVATRSVAVMAPDNDVPLCSITLPAEGRSFAVVLAQENPVGFVPFVVRLDDDSFKAGDYFFINRSAKSVVLKLGATELTAVWIYQPMSWNRPAKRRSAEQALAYLNIM